MRKILLDFASLKEGKMVTQKLELCIITIIIFNVFFIYLIIDISYRKWCVCISPFNLETIYYTDHFKKQHLDLFISLTTMSSNSFFYRYHFLPSPGLLFFLPVPFNR